MRHFEEHRPVRSVGFVKHPVFPGIPVVVDAHGDGGNSIFGQGRSVIAFPAPAPWARHGMSHVLPKDVLRVEHGGAGSPVVTDTERDVGGVYNSLNLAHLFERHGERLFDIHRLAGRRRQCDHRQTKILGCGQTDYVDLGIFDGALEVLADVPCAKDIAALGQHGVVQIDAGMECHPRGLHDIGDVLGAGDGPAANHGKAKRRGVIGRGHTGSLPALVDASPRAPRFRASGSCRAK